MDTLPSPFVVLYKKYVQINTHLTFLTSHSRSTIPTYEVLHELNHDISKLDLAMITYLSPRGDIIYEYVDENQVMLSFVEKVEFSWDKGYKQSIVPTVDNIYEEASGMKRKRPPHLLIFEFLDVKTHGIGSVVLGGKRYKRKTPPPVLENPEFFLASKDLSMSSLTRQQVLGIINTRNQRFKQYVVDYVREKGPDSAWNQLTAVCEGKIPELPSLQDPVQQIMQSKVTTVPLLDEKPSIEEMMEVLRDKEFYKDQITAEEVLTPKQDAKYAELNIDMIHPELEEALQQFKNILLSNGLYTHQVQAINNLNHQRHVIVTTSTSSGKSLIYQIPILNDILWDITNGISNNCRSTTAFFIFPTKALAQDQKRHLQELIEYLPSNSKRKIIIDTYDGDTPAKARTHIRSFADIIFTNPDTIHASILPNFDSSQGDFADWCDFLRKLKYVVVDELHVYKGTFGVHVNYVMARLQRVKHKVNSEDTSGGSHEMKFISCSATILNPLSHFRSVCAIPKDQEVAHVDEDGSPMAEKRLLIWQPAALMNKLGNVQSTLESATSIQEPFIPRENVIPALAKVLVQLLENLPTIKVIVFCPIRKMCELMIKEVRSLIKHTKNVSEVDIMSYRGGYSKSDRRQIEHRMFSGQLRAIVATNALELGIDLSDIDVVIAAGFPSLKLNLHQQFGRAGRARNSKGSLGIFVASSSPVDQHYMNNPAEICDKLTYEDLCVEGLMSNTLSMFILEMHLQCAAFEIPINVEEDAKWFVQATKDMKCFRKICEQRLLKGPSGFFHVDRKYLPRPSEQVAIRAIEETSVAVVDITNGRNIVIEEVEALRTSFTLYEGGIFLHQGFPYLVKEFNADEKFAKVVRVNVDWTTQQRDFTDIDPTEIEIIKCLNPVTIDKPFDVPIFFGKIQSTTIVFGYFKVNRRSEILEAVEVKNPPVKFFSKGLWIDIPSNAIEVVKEKQLSAPAGIHAAQHAIMNILPLYISGGATTNPNARFSSNVGESELSTECKAPEKEFAHRDTNRKRPARLIFYDSKGGAHGTGVSAKTFQHIDEILYTTYLRVKNCECEWGCPLCVAGNFCKEQLLVMSKPAAIIILGCLCGLDIDLIKDEVADGPEKNMPGIVVETIVSGPAHVKFSPEVEIIDVRRATKPLNPVIKRESQEGL